jgi:hypothetical protein
VARLLTLLDPANHDLDNDRDFDSDYECNASTKDSKQHPIMKLFNTLTLSTQLLDYMNASLKSHSKRHNAPIILPRVAVPGRESEYSNGPPALGNPSFLEVPFVSSENPFWKTFLYEIH